MQTGAFLPVWAAAPQETASGQALLFASLDTTPISSEAKAVQTRSVSSVTIPVTTQVDPVVSQAPKQQDTQAGGLGFSQEDPVGLEADRVEYNQELEIVSAVGDVEMVQAGRILRAEKISYYVRKDQVTATGNVVLNEVTGDTYFADNVLLEDQMKDGFVEGLNGILADGSRFTAEEAQKVADLKVIMRKASYTPCEPCKADPSRSPLWQIKAREVIHHKDEQRISYDDATFEVAGVPVMYTPYFSHSDGTVERKSGFLNPSVGFDSDLGASYHQEYYWSIAPDKDLTVGTMAMTEELPLLTGQYRQRFENASVEVEGGVTYSGRTDRVAGQDVARDEEERGHLFLDSLWDINRKWRAGAQLQLVTDEQYLRQYNFSSDDVLENKVYVERFDGRDYATAKMIRFKDVRVSDREVDQPNVLPEIYSRFLGRPNGFLGGRWSLEASALGLQREGDEQDMTRGSVKAGWQTRQVSSIGTVTTVDLMSRADLYRATDRDIANTTSGRSGQSSAARGFAYANLNTSYPFQKQFKDLQVVVEPIAAITAGTNLNDNNDIPNEDSQDVFLDMTNIFNPNRFPGNDRIEDEVHTTYGVRTGLYADNGNQAEIFLGQSYRLDEDDNPFPAGSGLSEQESDYVGNISATVANRFRINYALQLANDNLGSQRHEIDAGATFGPVSLTTRYFYANALQGTDFGESREQIRTGARYKFTDDWSVFGAMQYDLAEETKGLRKVSYGLDYEGQCATFMITGQRTLTNDSSGDSGTEIMMRIGLKNLGEFQTSGISLGTNE
jgi:LPS-assembly protein